MSDPVTNVEIEDVLSSIRRLVSDGDKARTRDPAPVAQADQQPDTANDAFAPDDAAPEGADDKPAKLVLTPALMVVDAAAEAQEASEPVDEGWFETKTPENTHEDDDTSGEAEEHTVEAEEDVDDDEEPLQLNDTVSDDVPSEITAQEDTQPNEEVFGAQDESSDRSELVATIAELEAAISDDTDEFEPDGSETTMGQTITWPGAAVRDASRIEDAETVQVGADAEPKTVEPLKDVTVAEPADSTDGLNVAVDDLDDDHIDDFDDDDLDGLLDAGGVALDEAALRELVADVVREELTGPMGERITRNVRKLVRREIYRILSSQDFD